MKVTWPHRNLTLIFKTNLLLPLIRFTAGGYLYAVLPPPPLIPSPLPEGISILGVVNGIAAHNWTTPSIISVGLGLGIAFSLWWIYFDTVDGSAIRALRKSKQIGVYVAWLYIHFPLIIGFTAFGVSVEHVVLSNQALALPSSEKWLLCASTFLCLFALGVIQMTSAMTASHVSLSSSSANPRRTIKYAAAIYSIVAAIVVLVLGATLNNNLLPVFLIGLMAIACTGQVILDVKRPHHHRFLDFR